MAEPIAKKDIQLLLLAFLILIFPGCTRKVTYISPQAAVSKHGSTVDFEDSSLVKKNLMTQYYAWKGTRYREGGLSRNGVDCSGFVYIIFRSTLGIKLPRTTAAQAKAGVQISKKNLRAGDLVFFKTGFFSHHVGIFLEGSRFIHASSSKGVTISSLENYYWQAKYLFSRRIII